MRVLADTSALLALSRRGDQYHAAAVKIAARHVEAGGRYIGSTLILSEFYSHLLYQRGPAAATAALTHLLDDPVHDWVDVTGELVRDAKNRWLARYADQNFSLVDAVSFEIMRRAKLTRAFSFDRHFETAGFELVKG